MNDLGFKIWFAFCAVLGVISIGLLFYLVVVVIDWISRQP